MPDIRCCNICIDRPERGKGMHWCRGCFNFVCTRPRCAELHAKKCKHPLGDPIPYGGSRPPATVREMTEVPEGEGFHRTLQRLRHGGCL
jgi:hypothetical protein